MLNERFTTQQKTYSQGSDHSTSQPRASYATERANVLFGCYRRGDANDPDTYVAAIAAVLSLYDSDLIREATDPRFGIQTTEKFSAFMPNAGELKIYCDKIAAHRARMSELAAIPPMVPASRRLEAPIEARPPGYLANIFVPEGHPRYARLVEWAKTAEPKLWKFERSSDNRPGLWVTLSVWQEGGHQQIGRKFDWDNVAPTQRDLTLTPQARHAMAQRYEPEHDAGSIT